MYIYIYIYACIYPHIEEREREIERDTVLPVPEEDQREALDDHGDPVWYTISYYRICDYVIV